LNSKTKNPWLQIPTSDYEGHMSAPTVMQLQLLDEIFENVLDELTPRSICILGSTAGNGFQHLIDRNIDRVVGIDINQEYLFECRNWFVQDVQNLHLICADLDQLELVNPMFDLIHAALIFEYVDVDALLLKIYNWLEPGGILSVVLQLHGNDSPAVSDSPYQSVKLLLPIIKLVDPDIFIEKALQCGLLLSGQSRVTLPTGKSFSQVYFKKVKPA